ncbi:hypothetical protein ACTWP4_17640 [Gracilibacillus sp. D59]|uniref:hypothetical protein n=1 Tax=Gracilibacillus sp. D59 TaxID=3457434 RepID=UPI003FCD3336
MENKRQISVRINQSKSSSAEHKSTDQSNLEDYIRENHHPVMDDHQVFQRNYTPDENEFNRSKKPSFWSKYKSFLLSAITAILIGSFLGLMMLKIFVDLDPEEVAFDQNTSNGQAVSATSDNSEKEDKTAESEQATFQSKAFDFFVTQAGVYSNKDAANQLVQELKGDQIESMVWSREEKYHVFVSLRSTSEESKQFSTNTFPSSYEMYAGKDWHVNSVSISLSEEEKSWLTDLGSLLEQMIAGNTDKAAIDQWLSDKPSNISEKTQVLSKEIESLKAADDEQSSQVILLKILNQYENLANK